MYDQWKLRSLDRYEEDAMYQIRWKNSRPYCWEATADGGRTWVNLESDNEDDSSEAIDEAAERFGVATNEWDLVED